MRFAFLGACILAAVAGLAIGHQDSPDPTYKCYVLQGPVLIVEFDGKRYVLPTGGGVIEAERSDWHGRRTAPVASPFDPPQPQPAAGLNYPHPDAKKGAK